MGYKELYTNKSDQYLCKEKLNQLLPTKKNHKRSALRNGAFHKENFLRQISEARDKAFLP